MYTPTTHFRFALIAAGVLGLTGVALGAFGAHGLAARLAEHEMTYVFETASRYHLFHSLALLAAAAWLRTATGSAATRMVWAVWFWTAGVIIFSGSLYWLALGGPRWLGPVTPLGGVALILGWLFVVLAAFGPQKN
jgi:uncharacterized membrane protein YgdD (TMEM256/DUF423 family)